jgi:hypothetical protein
MRREEKNMEKGNISALTVGRIGAWTDALGLHAHGPPCGYIKEHGKLFFFLPFTLNSFGDTFGRKQTGDRVLEQKERSFLQPVVTQVPPELLLQNTYYYTGFWLIIQQQQKQQPTEPGRFPEQNSKTTRRTTNELLASCWN